jgi:predicted GIY-YIG superfamily endonuclease
MQKLRKTDRPQFERMPRGVVYLLHFDSKISDKHTTQHYTGWTKYLAGRVAKHLAGRGARLTQVARERGIGFVVARTWPGDRTFERKIKNRHEGPTLCPICNPKRDKSAKLAQLDACL